MRQLCTANHFAWSGSPPPLASDSAARRPAASWTHGSAACFA